MNVIEYIPFGAANAIDRIELMRITGMPDRDIRRAIHQQATEDTPVINLGSGYFRPTKDDYEAVKRYVAQERRRACSIEERLRKMKRYLDTNDPDQLRIGGIKNGTI